MKPNALGKIMLVVEFSLLVAAEFLLSSREDDTRSWDNFLVYFSNDIPTRGVGDTFL